jgi:hypothetical protein
MTLAILNCKNRKQSYPCPAREMYSKSHTFRVMYQFARKYYDAVAILSAKYGLVRDDEIIEPYNLMMAPSGYAAKSDTPVLTEDEKIEWAKKVTQHPIWQQYETIDLHIGDEYYKPLAGKVSGNKISLPTNLGILAQRYKELDKAWANGSRDFDILTEKRKSPWEEEMKAPRWWYHPTFGSHLSENVYEAARYAKQFDPLIDMATFQMVIQGRCAHHKGWVIDQSIKTFFDGVTWRVVKSS